MDHPVVVVAFNGLAFGLRPETGERVWEADVGAREVRIAFAGDCVFAISALTVACLDLATGHSKWTARWKAPATAIDSTILVMDDRVLIGGGGTVTCFAASDGTQLWREDFKGKGTGTVALGIPGNVAQCNLQP